MAVGYTLDSHSLRPVHRQEVLWGARHTGRVVRETDGPAESPQPRQRPDQRWLLDRLAVALAVLQAGALFTFIRVGGWFQDDFQNLEIAQRSGLTHDYLTLTVFGHPQPGIRLINWILIRVAPMNYQLVTALLAAAVGFASWMVYRILRLLFRPDPAQLVLMTMTGATALWLPTEMWWAGGSGVTACVLAGMLSTHATVRCYLAERWSAGAGWGVLAGCWLAARLTCYERTLFGGVFAAAFLPMAVCSRIRLRDVALVLRRAWTAYLTLAGVGLSYLVYYLSGSFVRGMPGYTAAQVVHYLWIAWSSALVPGLFGGPLNFDGLGPLSSAGTPLWWLLLTEWAVLALVVLGLRRLGWRSVRGWALFLPIFVAAQYAIATARLTVHGVRIGDEYRYISDMAPLAVLALAVMLFHPVVVPAVVPSNPVVMPSSPAETRPAMAPARLRGQYVLAGISTLVIWAVFVTSAVPASRRWHTDPGRTYVANLRAGLAAADRKGPWSLYTRFVPVEVSLPSYGQYITTPLVAGLLSKQPIRRDDPRYPMYTVDNSGHLVPAEFRTAGRVQLGCSTRAGQQLVAVLPTRLPTDSWTLSLRYSVAKPVTLRFAISNGIRVIEATGSFRGFPVSGQGHLTLLLRTSAIKSLRLDAAAAGICVTDVDLGQPVPASWGRRPRCYLVGVGTALAGSVKNPSSKPSTSLALDSLDGVTAWNPVVSG